MTSIRTGADVFRYLAVVADQMTMRKTIKTLRRIPKGKWLKESKELLAKIRERFRIMKDAGTSRIGARHARQNSPSFQVEAVGRDAKKTQARRTAVL